MKFKVGDSVRYKSQKTIMTITSINTTKSGKSRISCVYMDVEDNDKYFTIYETDSIELVPDKVIKKNNKIRNRSGLKSYIQDHPIIVYSAIAILCFSAGFLSRGELFNIFGKEIIDKNSYILKTELTEFLANNYIEKKIYNDLGKKHNILIKKYSEIEMKLNEAKSDALNKYILLLDRTYKELEEVKARYRGFDNKYDKASVNEQRLLNKINIYNKEIEKIQYISE